jgi:hypothetical protein
MDVRSAQIREGNRFSGNAGSPDAQLAGGPGDMEVDGILINDKFF